MVLMGPAVYWLGLLDPAAAPSGEALERLHEKLPGVAIEAEGGSVTFVEWEPGSASLRERVHGATRAIYGHDWGDTFFLLPDDVSVGS